MPHYAAAGESLAVPEAYTDRTGSYGWDRLLPIYRDRLLVWGEHAYAMPLLGDALLCFYRRDLFQDPQHQAAFAAKFGHKLDEPATWEDFADIAEYFHQHKPFSLPPLPQDDEQLDAEFYAVAAPYVRQAIHAETSRGNRPTIEEDVSFHYDVSTMAVRLDAPGFVHALQLLRRLQACRPPTPALEPPAAFARGEAVLCLAGPAWIARFAKSPAIKDRFGLARLPGSRMVFDYQTGKPRPAPGNFIPYLGAGGWIGVVPRRSTQPEAAFALLAALSDLKTSRDVVIDPEWGGGVYRLDHLESQTGWHAFRLGDQTQRLVDILRQSALHTGLLNPVLCLRIPEEESHRRAVDVELRAALRGQKEPKKALADAAARWHELDSSRALKVRQKEYRLSLGLDH
jgi:multiple sugar transport system substrate-binding protein